MGLFGNKKSEVAAAETEAAEAARTAEAKAARAAKVKAILAAKAEEARAAKAEAVAEAKIAEAESGAEAEKIAAEAKAVRVAAEAEAARIAAEVKAEKDAETARTAAEAEVADPTAKGIFAKIKEGLRKTKDSFSQKIELIVNSFTKIDEDFFEELFDTLVLSDIGVKTSEEICAKLRAEVKRTGITDPAAVTGLLKGIVAEMLGGDNELLLSAGGGSGGNPDVVLVIGVNGAGKTTTIGKLAYNLKRDGRKVLIVAADTFRAAAIDQLDMWAKRAGVDIVKRGEGSDPASVVYDGLDAAAARGADVVLIDTAGRLHNKAHLMEELRKIARIIKGRLPGTENSADDVNKIETLLVLDATTGQNAVNQAELFGKVADITGIVLTKLDGTAKGGIVIPIKNELGYSVKLVGVGEKLDDLIGFDSNAYAESLFDDKHTA